MWTPDLEEDTDEFDKDLWVTREGDEMSKMVPTEQMRSYWAETAALANDAYLHTAPVKPTGTNRENDPKYFEYTDKLISLYPDAVYGTNPKDRVMEAFVRYEKEKNRIVVSYRGTAVTAADVPTDADAVHKFVEGIRFKDPNSGSEIRFTFPVGRIDVHRGFWERFADLFQPVLDKLDERVRRWRTDNPGNDDKFPTVLFTGHSLGGAVASIGAFVFQMLFPTMDVECITWEAPRAWGAYAVKQFLKYKPTRDLDRRTVRMIHSEDLVTAVPLAPIGGVTSEDYRSALHQFDKNRNYRMDDTVRGFNPFDPREFSWGNNYSHVGQNVYRLTPERYIIDERNESAKALAEELARQRDKKKIKTKRTLGSTLMAPVRAVGRAITAPVRAIGDAASWTGRQAKNLGTYLYKKVPGKGMNHFLSEVEGTLGSYIQPQQNYEVEVLRGYNARGKVGARKSLSSSEDMKKRMAYVRSFRKQH